MELYRSAFIYTGGSGDNLPQVQNFSTSETVSGGIWDQASGLGRSMSVIFNGYPSLQLIIVQYYFVAFVNTVRKVLGMYTVPPRNKHLRHTLLQVFSIVHEDS